MLKSKKEFKRIVAQILKTSETELIETPMSISDSMTGNIEDGFDGSIFCFYHQSTGKKYVAKIKGSSYVENVCNVMNTEGSAEFKEKFEKAASVFNIIDSFIREKCIYEGIFGFSAQFIPAYYGSYCTNDTCIIVIEYLEINQEKLNFARIADFLAGLHDQYLGMESTAEAFCVSKTSMEDYLGFQQIDELIIEKIEKWYPDFPADALNDLKQFYREPQTVYQLLSKHERTICHGDFSVKNISFTDGRLVVYDWELSTYNHPEFDLVTFLVLFPKCIDSDFINYFTGLYLQQVSKRQRLIISDSDFKELMAFNIKLYMTTRFHAMMIICRNVPMPYMGVAIQNWLTLYNHYC